MMAVISTNLPSEPITGNPQPSASFPTPGNANSYSALPLPIPPEPLLIDLFCNFIEDPAAILIREWSPDGVMAGSWSVAEFLRDVCLVSRCIWLELSVEERGRLGREGENVFIAVVSGGCYAFAVLVVAVYGLGGVIVPISPRVHPDEAKYFLETCNASLICAVPRTADHVQSILKAINMNISVFTYTPHRTEINASDIKFHLSDSPPPHSSTKGFALLYTSGTTGPPKGVFHDRSSTTGGFLIHFLKLSTPSSGNIYLHHMPVHWASGFMTFFSGILLKACVEFCSEVFSSSWFLERLVDENWPPVTSLHLPPPLLNAVASEFADLGNRDPDLYETVLKGIGRLKVLASGGSTVTPKQRVVWRVLLGKPLSVGYGMSESFGVVAYTDYGKRGEYPLDSVGLRMPNVNMKFDDNGEICIKSPVLFKKYISPYPNATNNAYDSEGFFRTGDLGRIEDDVVYLLGRASQDVIRYYLWRIYAPEVENALSQIDDIAHAIVLGVEDSDCGQRVAAVVVYRQQNQTHMLSLADLRVRLVKECSLEAFKLPTLLKVVGSFAEIPVTEAGKPIKDRIREIYFSETAIDSSEVEVWTSEPRDSSVRARPFVWDGLQR